MTDNLTLAILALDSYNRGYNAQLKVQGQTIGDISVLNTAADLPISFKADGFYASAYKLSDGSEVISYRGTTPLLAATAPAATISSMVGQSAWDFPAPRRPGTRNDATRIDGGRIVAPRLRLGCRRGGGGTRRLRHSDPSVSRATDAGRRYA
jgi:hypothetical protein